MNLEIITPGKKIYTHEISLIQLPGSKGSFEILQNHAPIVSTLEKGKIKIVENNGKTIFFDISGGVVECRSNNIVVLADWCQNSL
ncbi:MAG TPA: ATP synthase F1 subunit epsilon [Prolixibacteraceae bacterium]|nr:ATP synthase F1 subunit epsilon [Prolixibacteraceae bacterium]HPR59613.1 ATP synthase F1 subunit epsilon [Prolixibacteraceae bacterium]